MEDDFIHFKLFKQVSWTTIYISESGGCLMINQRFQMRYPQSSVTHNKKAHSAYPIYRISHIPTPNAAFNFYPHRAVALTYLPIPDMFHTQVDHLDGNIFNNNLWNLEWVTEAENHRRAAEAKKERINYVPNRIKRRSYVEREW